MSKQSTPSPPKRQPQAADRPGSSREELLALVEELEAENARLRELSLVDMLTGLYNYRYFLEKIDVEIERVRRTSAPCALLMLDIDLFKQVNDTHGHEAGNAVLRETARIVGATTRATDIACRYGGEEFAVILPATHLQGAVRIADRIRRTLKRRTIQHADAELQVTISAGAACFSYRDKFSRAEFIELADAALYKAKRGGRDQVCFMTIEAPATEVSPAEKELLK